MQNIVPWMGVRPTKGRWYEIEAACCSLVGWLPSLGGAFAWVSSCPATTPPTLSVHVVDSGHEKSASAFGELLS